MGSSDVQGKMWSAAPEDWLENERFCIPLYEAVFSGVDLADGVRILDLGCGAGLAMQMAAERGAVVTGIDAADGLLGVARSRLPDADLRKGDLEALPYPDDSFDVVTSFNAVQFATDPVAALREAKRVATPGGKVGIVTWGELERCDIRLILAAIGPLLPSPLPGAVGPFALSEPGKLESLAAAAGLVPERSAEVPAPFTFPNLDAAVRIQMSAGPFQRAVEHAGKEVVSNAVREAFFSASQSDGSYRLNNTFRYLIATA